ncbi:MAG: tagatose 1,6-diphosphate aldolase [Hyphomicrobiales bacterium]|nr:tagatose 1,6-diphosphate aldolase [Hyphomicrobiales bacterium]
MTPLSPGKLWGMRRMADANGRFKMVAVDQRPPIKNPIRAARGTAEAPYEDVAGFKLMLLRELQGHASAMLLDPHFALPQGLSILSPAKGLIVTLEDSIFRETPGGRLSCEIDDWSVEKIKRCGGDAVKVLAWYRPDADLSVNLAQHDFTRRIGDACARYDIPFLFELLVYPLAKDTHQTTDYVEMQGKHADHVLDSVREFAKPEYGIDMFKLESPVPARDIGEADRSLTQKLFNAMGALCGRPWVMLSAGASMAEFKTVMEYAYAAGASGYLAGRAIWADPFRAFPDWDAIRAGLRGRSVPYMAELNALTDKAGLPWFDHPLYGGKASVAHADASFRHHYGVM